MAALMVHWVTPAGAEEFYRSDFTKAVSPKIWSFTNIYKVEPDGERILGRVAHQGSIAMKHADLPPHALVRLRFELHLFGKFEGASNQKHASGFSIGQKDGPLLFTTNLSTAKPEDGQRQSFPDEWPGGSHPAQTGRLAGDHRL